ncbi:hypothetical protein EGR_05519 [Echinococcus granulosus]|uniref:Uncharacterized protein n=1 Tax=Echinococcus granulosus TaxID=6210 RepID=W6UDZ6_ECHGR|nr:hypothetical protein EGR_05519 [Echinococcus granulosus]EUB59620.1 hypothetical protein EGR_05519 [Echinococcus granulosus]
MTMFWGPISFRQSTSFRSCSISLLNTHSRKSSGCTPSFPGKKQKLIVIFVEHLKKTWRLNAIPTMSNRKMHSSRSETAPIFGTKCCVVNAQITWTKCVNSGFQQCLNEAMVEQLINNDVT